MDEAEFRRLLCLFPVVRSRSFCADDEASRAIASIMQDNEPKQGQDAKPDKQEGGDVDAHDESGEGQEALQVPLEGS